MEVYEMQTPGLKLLCSHARIAIHLISYFLVQNHDYHEIYDPSKITEKS